MARGWIHTVTRNGIWVNEVEGGHELSRHVTKEEAVRVGRGAARARQVEHLIHRVNGEIGERNSYGEDAFPPAG